MLQAGFAHANHIANEIREEIQDSNKQLLNMLSTMNETPPVVTDSSADDSPPNDETEQANAMIGDDRKLDDMMKLFKKMQSEFKKEVQEMKRELTNCPNNDNENRGGLQKRKTPDNPTFTRRTTDKYCWTHGGCAHQSADCNAKASGHQDNATFRNKQGGSKAFCS